MTAVTEMPCHFAALRLAGPAPSPETLMDRISDWLESAGQTVEDTGLRADGALWLRTDEATVRLAAEGAARLSLRVADRSRKEPGTTGEALLLHLIYRLAVRLTPEQIEWQDDTSVVDAQEFIALARRAAGGIRPARPGAVRNAPRPASRPAPARDTLGAAGDAGLRAAFVTDTPAPAQGTDDAPQSAPLRLAAWAFSGAAALIWLPLAPVLLAVQLRDGPNLRLSAQACSLVGLFTALEHAGAFGQVAALMPV